MALFKSTQVTNKVPVPSANAATDLIYSVGDFAIPAGLASGDVIEMGAIPAGYVPVDLIVDNEACGTTVTSNFGILSGSYDSSDSARTCGAEFASAQALQTAGIKRMAAAGGGRIAPTTADRGWGFEADAVTTPTAGADVRATLVLRPQSEGV